MNQAFKLAQNEYIIFLNAGDIFFSKNTIWQTHVSIMMMQEQVRN